MRAVLSCSLMCTGRSANKLCIYKRFAIARAAYFVYNNVYNNMDNVKEIKLQ